VLNLALNARDAMPQGGRLVIETKRVEIAGGSAPPVPPGRYAMLTVTDDGVGMDEETRRHIFEPFFTTKPEGAGSGLGLATVHRIVERHGGAIRVDTAPGRGTTFRVYLPCVERLAEPERPAVEPSARQGGRETVLVAEDSEAVREVTRELLEALGYTVVTAGSGEEALEAARAHHGPIDVLLTDVVMPGMRGASLARQLRAVRPGLRVLFMSGYGDGAEPGGAGERDAVLRKPFDQDLLARALREALDQDGSRGPEGLQPLLQEVRSLGANLQHQLAEEGVGPGEPLAREARGVVLVEGLVHEAGARVGRHERPQATEHLGIVRAGERAHRDPERPDHAQPDVRPPDALGRPATEEVRVVGERTSLRVRT